MLYRIRYVCDPLPNGGGAKPTYTAHRLKFLCKTPNLQLICIFCDAIFT